MKSGNTQSLAVFRASIKRMQGAAFTAERAELQWLEAPKFHLTSKTAQDTAELLEYSLKLAVLSISFYVSAFTDQLTRVGNVTFSLRPLGYLLFFVSTLYEVTAAFDTAHTSKLQRLTNGHRSKHTFLHAAFITSQISLAKRINEMRYCSITSAMQLHAIDTFSKPLS